MPGLCYGLAYLDWDDLECDGPAEHFLHRLWLTAWILRAYPNLVYLYLGLSAYYCLFLHGLVNQDDHTSRFYRDSFETSVPNFVSILSGRRFVPVSKFGSRFGYCDLWNCICQHLSINVKLFSAPFSRNAAIDDTWHTLVTGGVQPDASVHDSSWLNLHLCYTLYWYVPSFVCVCICLQGYLYVYYCKCVRVSMLLP